MTVDETLRTSPQTPEGQYDALTGILQGDMADPQLPPAEIARVNTMRMEILKANPKLLNPNPKGRRR